MDRLEKRWEEIKIYIPYNSAMDMLMIGSFKEAKFEFKKFLEKDSSIKSKVIYALIVLSSFLRADLVNPLANFKCRSKVFLKNFLKRF
jgi:hypothetical protein